MIHMHDHNDLRFTNVSYDHHEAASAAWTQGPTHSSFIYTSYAYDTPPFFLAQPKEGKRSSDYNGLRNYIDENEFLVHEAKLKELVAF